MNIQHSFRRTSFFASLPFLFLANYTVAQEPQRGPEKYVCMESHPETMCNPSNTCGSASTPCEVDIKRSGSSSASSTPSIRNAKSNALFCVQSGTTVTWKSSAKNTGFVVDFGPSSPFDPPEAIIGGAARPVSVAAKRPGCFKYSAGACISGSAYGMCGSVETELVVTGAGRP